MDVQIRIVLDYRRPKSLNEEERIKLTSGKNEKINVNLIYPVKIRVWDAFSQKARLFQTNIDLTEREFLGAWESQKILREFQDLRVKLDAVKMKANNAAKDLEPFSFAEFSKRLYRKSGDGTNIIYHYQQVMSSLIHNGQLSTESSYDLSLKSLKAFIKERKGSVPNSISFFDINKEWLTDYQNYMVNEKEKSYTTVGIYLRCLRAIFNRAISNKDISLEIYPFGKKKYEIPSTKKVNKALSQEQLKKLLEFKCNSTFQQQAKDFWFFSYSCNGMNIKDIALLKFKDLDEGAIRFFRAKTKNTSKGNLKLITAHLTPHANKVIETYGNQNIDNNDYIFKIIKKGDSLKEQRRLIQNFTRLINQHMEALCELLDLPKVTTYWARHSFTTVAVHKGASMEFMRESLGHSSMKTTLGYFGGFEDKTKKEFAKSIMDFTTK